MDCSCDLFYIITEFSFFNGLNVLNDLNGLNF
jgi:hypothetical protein